MDVVILGLLLLAGLFGLVVLFGAPYVPSLKPQIEVGLDMLNLKKGQTMLELGCGDGRVLRAAAKRGWRAVGYEINPLLALVARLRTWRWRRQVRVVWGDYWRSRWPKAQGIYVFLLKPYMKKLDKTIVQQCLGKNIKLVSFAFPVPGRQWQKRQNGVFLYEYRLSSPRRRR
jgi:SAM-dependent methyltransferase